jgi:putative component of toxin-antitoxin plasmid stabilization module
MLSRAVASRRDCCLLEQTTNDFSIRMTPTWSGDRLRGFAKQACVFAILRIDWDRVCKARVALYREEDGSCPFVEWFDKLPAKVQDKCYLRLERLREMGHELRRPEADFLRDGIYELRVSLGGVHHRILYFFHGAIAAVVSSRPCERAGGPAERDRPGRRTQEAV